MKRAFDIIERRRVDTGPSFAEATKSVVEYWDHITTIFWERLYTCDVDPSLDEREPAMFIAIPIKYRFRVAPG